MSQPDGENLLKNEEARSTSFRWPGPVHEKLGELVVSANEEGVKASAKEVAGALIAFSELSGEELLELVMKYRKARVTDIIPE